MLVIVDIAANLHSIIDPMRLEISMGLAPFEARELAEQATRMVEGFCGRILVRETVTEKVTSQGTEIIRLSRYPVIEIESFKYNDQELTDYNLDPDRGWLIRTSGVWSPSVRTEGYYAPFEVPSRNPNYTIKYSAGYTQYTCPGDLRSAVMDIAQGIYQQSQTGASPYSSESIGDWSYTRGSQGLMTAIKDRIGPYRRLA